MMTNLQSESIAMPYNKKLSAIWAHRVCGVFDQIWKKVLDHVFIHIIPVQVRFITKYWLLNDSPDWASIVAQFSMFRYAVCFNQN